MKTIIPRESPDYPLDYSKIRKVIQDFKVSSEALAKQTGIPLSFLLDIEEGKVDPPLSAIALIADKLCCSIDYLVGFEWDNS